MNNTQKDLIKISNLLKDIYTLLENDDQLNDIIATIGIFQQSIDDSIADINNYLTSSNSWTVVTAERTYTFHALNFKELLQVMNVDVDDIKAIIKD